MSSFSQERTLKTMEALCKDSHVMLLNAITNNGAKMDGKFFCLTILSAHDGPAGQAIFGEYNNISRKEVANRLRLIARMIDTNSKIDGST